MKDDKDKVFFIAIPKLSAAFPSQKIFPLLGATSASPFVSSQIQRGGV
ncbi:MAG: hypothetical protein AAF570_08570 [Bacteroidota bacterium]